MALAITASDIYRAERRSHGYAAATNIGGPINTEQSQPDLYVGAAGQMMILAITDHPEGFGGDDLYVSYFRNGSWTTPRNRGHRGQHVGIRIRSDVVTGR